MNWWTYKWVRLPLKVNMRMLMLFTSAPVKLRETSDLSGQKSPTGSSLIKFWSSDLCEGRKVSLEVKINGPHVLSIDCQVTLDTYNMDKWFKPLKASPWIDSIKLCPKSNSTSCELKVKQPEGTFFNRLYFKESILMMGKYLKGDPFWQLSSLITFRSKSLSVNWVWEKKRRQKQNFF